LLALAAILISLLFEAKQLPRSSMCRSDLKQIASGLLMYAEDYDRRLPPTSYAKGPHSVVLPWLLDPYIKDGEVWACPTAVKDGARDHSFERVPGDATVSFGYNGAALAPDRVGLPLDRVKQAEDTVAFVDAGSYLATPPSLAPALGGSVPAYRHTERAYVAWLDEHVTGEPQTELEATAASEGDKLLAPGIDRFLLWNLR
jgi:hypothetical protein